MYNVNKINRLSSPSKFAMKENNLTVYLKSKKAQEYRGQSSQDSFRVMTDWSLIDRL